MVFVLYFTICCVDSWRFVVVPTILSRVRNRKCVVYSQPTNRFIGHHAKLKCRRKQTLWNSRRSLMHSRCLLFPYNSIGFFHCKVELTYAICLHEWSTCNGTRTTKRLVGEFAQFMIVSAAAICSSSQFVIPFYLSGNRFVTILLFLLSMLLNMAGTMRCGNKFQPQKLAWERKRLHWKTER